MNILGLFKSKKNKNSFLLHEHEELVDGEKRAVILPPPKPQKSPRSPKIKSNKSNNNKGGFLPRRDNAVLGDPEDDELIPTIYCVSGVKGLLKPDKKWLTLCAIPDEIVTYHFTTILTILNFLRRKDLVYYKFVEQPEQILGLKYCQDQVPPSVIISSVGGNGGSNGSGSNQNSSKDYSNNSPSLTPRSNSISSTSSFDLSGGGNQNSSNTTTSNNNIIDNGMIMAQQPSSIQPQQQQINRNEIYSSISKKRIDSNRIFISPGQDCKFPEEMNIAVDKLLNEGNPKEHYKNLDFEAKGGFGSVFAAKNKNIHSAFDKVCVALKKMPHKTPKQKRMNLNEIGFMKYCQHPNIVKFLCSYQKNDELWLIMEFMEGGTLREAISNFIFSEEKIAFIAREILQGIEYLHKNGLCHRDLKSSNIMISTKGEIKIIDFGLAIDFNKEHEDIHMCGSPFWMPPEQIHGRPHSFSVDIWSFGVCIAEMLKRKVPNHTSRLKAMVVVATEGLTFKKDQYPEWSDEVHDFVEKCLQPDPSKRPSASELLSHPFLLKACNISEIKDILPALFMSHTLARQGLF